MRGGSGPPLCPRCQGKEGETTPKTWTCRQCGYVAPICLYWRPTGYSPGEQTASLDTLALELYGQIQALGWDAVISLRTIELNEDEAEGLLARLQWVPQYLQQLAAHEQGKTR